MESKLSIVLASYVFDFRNNRIFWQKPNAIEENWYKEIPTGQYRQVLATTQGNLSVKLRTQPLPIALELSRDLFDNSVLLCQGTRPPPDDGVGALRALANKAKEIMPTLSNLVITGYRNPALPRQYMAVFSKGMMDDTDALVLALSATGSPYLEFSFKDNIHFTPNIKRGSQLTSSEVLAWGIGNAANGAAGGVPMPPVAAKAPAINASPTAAIISTSEQRKIDNTCAICLEAQRNAILNCGHLGCFECLTAIGIGKPCPICRVSITSVMKVFL